MIPKVVDEISMEGTDGFIKASLNEAILQLAKFLKAKHFHIWLQEIKLCFENMKLLFWFMN